jgi:leader peptidase (prepilin peptidase) / N-methyltransferase
MILVLAIAFLGWIDGVLVNFIADTLPMKRKLAAPICVACGQEQANVNYFLWPRRCVNCNRGRGLRIWLVEFFFITAAVWLWYTPANRLGFLAGLLLLSYFGVIAIIDIEHRLILHSTSLVGVVLGSIIGIWLHGFRWTILGGAAGFAIMLLLYFMGGLFLRFLSHRRGEMVSEEALGFGDVTLSGVLGLMLGWPGILPGLALAIFLAGAASLMYLIAMVINRKYRSDLAIPYGPFLILGAVMLLFFRGFIAARFGL